MFAKAFLIASLERAVKTFAQSLLALLGADGLGLLDPKWLDVLAVAGMAALLSLLSSVASSGIGGVGPSVANEVTSPPAPGLTDVHAAGKITADPYTNPHG